MRNGIINALESVFKPVLQSHVHGRQLEKQKGYININPSKVIIGIAIILVVFAGLGLIFAVTKIIQMLSKKKKTGPIGSGGLQRKYTGTIPDRKFGHEMDDIDEMDEEEMRRSLRASKKATLRKSAIQRAESIQRIGPNLYGLTQDEIDALHPQTLETNRGLLANQETNVV